MPKNNPKTVGHSRFFSKTCATTARIVPGAKQYIRQGTNKDSIDIHLAAMILSIKVYIYV